MPGKPPVWPKAAALPTPPEVQEANTGKLYRACPGDPDGNNRCGLSRLPGA
jgi:hypothetical protein